MHRHVVSAELIQAARTIESHPLTEIQRAGLERLLKFASREREKRLKQRQPKRARVGQTADAQLSPSQPSTGAGNS